MADGFTVIAQRRTVQPQANGQVQDVVEITARMVPSGVTFTRVIPFMRWQQMGVDAALAPIAASIDAVMRAYPVVGSIPYQSVDATGNISNALMFTVTTEAERSSPSPSHTTTVVVPIQALYGGGPVDSYFKPALDALEHSAAL